MKRCKDLKKRSLALLLCLVMILCMFPVTAFAEDGEGDEPAVTDEIPGSEDSEDSETTGPADEDASDDEDETEEVEREDVSSNPPVIPEDPKPVVNTNVDGNTTITDTRWEWEYEKEDEKVDGEYKDDPDRTEGEKDENGLIVDQILNGENLDDIEDGEHSKTDYYDKDDVKYVVSGSQDRTDWNEIDNQGRPVSDSFQVDGEQKTTEVTTTTTKDVTTTVTKDTDVTHTDEELEEGTEDPESVTPGETHISDSDGERTAVTDTTDTGTTPSGTVGTESGSVTVTMNESNGWSDTQEDTASRIPILPDASAFFAQCVGWAVKDEHGEVIGTLDENGNVVDEDENIVKTLAFECKDGVWSVTLNAVKTDDAERTGDERDVTNGQKGDTVEGSYMVTAGDQTTVYAEGYKPLLVDEDGNPVRVKLDEDGNPACDEDGNYIPDENGALVYVKEDVTTRTDSNEWVQIVKITEQDWTQFTEFYNHTITVTVPEAREVTGEVTITAGENNGQLNLAVVNGPDGQQMTISGLDNKFQYRWGGYVSGGLYVNYQKNDKGTVGYAKTSVYKLEMIDEDGNVVKDANGNAVVIYGYCVEKDVDIENGQIYEFVNITDAVNNGAIYEDDDYGIKFNYETGAYISEADRTHLNYIAKYGYWGDNLNAVKKLVPAQYQSYITAGTARSITQAALWLYADASTDRTWGNASDVLFTKDLDWTTLTTDQRVAYMALYNALISGTEDDTQTDLDDPNYKIETSDITSATITVKNKVSSVEELNELVAEEQKYEIEASVTMAIVPSNFGDGVMLYVYVEGQTNPVASARLDATTTTVNGYTIERTGTENNYTYTVKGLQLTAGTTLNFSISGEQKLGSGIYLLQNSQYQNFATVIRDGSTRTIDINVEMSFSVKENTGSVVDEYSDRQLVETWTVTTTETQDYTSVTNYEDVKTTTVTVTSSEKSHEAVTNVSEKLVEDVFWSDSGSQSYTYIDESFTPEEGDDDDDDDDVEINEEDIPLSELPDEEIELPDEDIPLAEMPDEEIELDDPDIPLADVPQTGDVSGMWYVMTVLSAAGLICMAAYERKKRQENRG